MTSRPVRAACAALLVTAITGFPAAVASAHTDFDFSLPTDGATVGEPVGEITVAFTLPVTLVGNGFEVLDPQGTVRDPVVVTEDDAVFRLRLEPPLTGGAVGVRYVVRAEDGHELAGAFSFMVDAPSPTTAIPATSAATTIVAPSTSTTAAPPVTSTSAPEVTTTSQPLADTIGSTSPPADDGGGGGGVGLVLIIAAAVALGGAGLLIVRSRSSRRV